MECQPLEALDCLGAAAWEVLHAMPLHAPASPQHPSELDPELCECMQVLFHMHAQRAKALLGQCAAPRKVVVRLVNYPNSAMQIRLLKASSIGNAPPLSCPVHPKVAPRGCVSRQARFAGIACLAGKRAAPCWHPCSTCRPGMMHVQASW